MPASGETDAPLATVLTPTGAGAIATIAFWGDSALIDSSDAPMFRAKNRRPLADQPLDNIVYGEWGRETVESVVVCRVATEMLELHCHGGNMATTRILDDLQQIGCSIVDWSTFTKQTESQFQAEGLWQLSQTTTLKTAHIVARQYETMWPQAISELLQQVDAIPVNKTQENERLLACRNIADQIKAMLGWAKFGRHLTQPWQVVVFGRPNVGKSSLINQILGYGRSIVYDESGTTRDVVVAQTAIDGWPIEISDTAGIRDETGELEGLGIRRAHEKLSAADCRIAVIDTGQAATDDDRKLLDLWSDALIVAHKSDRPGRWGSEIPHNAIWASSKTGSGIDQVCQRIVEQLIPLIPPAETTIPITARQVELLTAAVDALHDDELSRCRLALQKILA